MSSKMFPKMEFYISFFGNDGPTSRMDFGDDVSNHLNDVGYVVIPGLIGSKEIKVIERFVEDVQAGTAGTRRMIDLPECRELASASLATDDCAAIYRPMPLQCNARYLSSRPTRTGSCRFIRISEFP